MFNFSRVVLIPLWSTSSALMSREDSKDICVGGWSVLDMLLVCVLSVTMMSSTSRVEHQVEIKGTLDGSPLSQRASFDYLCHLDTCFSVQVGLHRKSRLTSLMGQTTDVLYFEGPML